MGNRDIDNVNQIFVDRKGVANNKLVLYDNGTSSTTNFYGFGIQGGTLLYNVPASTDNHRFYYAGTNELFRINHGGVYSYRDLSVTGNISLSGTVDGVDVAALNTTLNNHIGNTNNPHGVLASQINDFDTEVSANADVKANTAYRNTGHLPLAGGTLTGNLNMGYNKIISLATPTEDTDGANKKYIDDKFRLYEEGKVLAERYSTTAVANNTAEMDAQFNGKTPNASKYLTNLYTIGWSGDQFGVIYNCYLYVPTDGNIKFRVRSDDSSDWFIDDVLVASNYGGHAVGGEPVVTSTVFMTAGFHKSFSRFIEVGGGEGIIHDWDLKGGSNFTTIPTANIFIPKLGLSDITDIGSGAIITTSERADIKTNSEYTAIGHLPLTGGTLTGDLSINGELNIGGEKITTGATNGLQLSGPSNDIGGPHIQAFVSSDNYPVFQQLNNSHGSIAMCFDAYADGFTWKSSSSRSNAIIYKSNTDLEFSYSSGVAAGGEVTWNAGFSMDLANGLVSFSNGVDVIGDLTISGTVDGVDLKDLNSSVVKLTGDQVVAGTKSFSSRIQASGNTITPYGAGVELGYSGTEGLLVSFDRSNNLYKDMRYNALSHSIECSGVDILNISSTGLNITGNITVSGTVDGVDVAALNTDVKANTTYRNTGHLPLSGGTLTGDLNMGNQDIDNINQIFIDRKGAANNKIVLYDGGTPSTTNFYGFGVQSATLLYNVDVSTANHKFYYGGTNELFRIGNAAVYSYRDLDVKGNITVSGTVDGVDVAAMKSAVDTNTAKVSASGSINTHSDVNITTPTDGHVLTYNSGEWKNIPPAAADGYLPLDGTTAMTGTLNINPSNHGEKLVFYETTPTEVPYGIQTSNGYIMHGVEYNGSHVFIYDIDGKLATAGYLLQLKRTGSIMNTELSMNNHKITDLTTPTDTADATTKGYVDTAVNAKLSVNGSSIMIGNLNMGNYDIDNVNQVFVNRSTVANNKVVLWDNGSGSTTDFYGFGIQAATLMYNINSTGANHKFYYAGIYELFRIGHEGVYSYRNLDVTGNITVSGTVDGVDLKALNTTVGGKLSLSGGTMSGNIDMGGYNINTVGTVDGYNLDTLNANINSKLPLTGGVITNGSINIYTQGRSGSHGAVKGLYVTSDFGAYSSGAEFRHSNGTQGIGIGYAGIYACGSNGSQDLNISSKGTGTINLHQNGWNYAVIRRRPSYNNEAQMSFRMSGNGGCGEIGYNGALVAWASSNHNGNPTGGIVYLSVNSSSWVGASDRRLKCDIVGLEVEDCCARIALLKPCNYCWKADETKKRNTGFIADEVKQVYPDLVSDSNITVGDDENIEGIDYTSMIPILVGAIQSIMGKMNELKNRIEILEKPIV